MRSSYWVQYAFLFAASTGSLMAIEYHKTNYHKRVKAQCEQCRPGCPVYQPPVKAADYILWHPVNRFNV